MPLANVGYALGRVLFVIAVAHMAPVLVAMGYGENQAMFSFAIAGVMAAFVGGLLIFTYRDMAQTLQKRDVFIFSALLWPIAAVFAGIAFKLTGSVPTYGEAIFEALSGLTTTGATIINDVDTAAKSVLFWRALLSWVGGLALIAMAVVFAPLVNLGGAMMTANILPHGETGGLIARMRGATVPLLPIYGWLTVGCLFALWFAQMPFFDALCHAMSAISSGGFSTRTQSVAAFDLPLAEWVLIPFMFLAGINFTFHWALFKGRIGHYFEDREVKGYVFLILLGALVLVTGHLALSGPDPDIDNVFDSLRIGIFTAVSAASTTGFMPSSAVPLTLLGIFMMSTLVFIGGTTGSTAGGFKVMRIIILTRHALRELARLSHPNGVVAVRFNRGPAPEAAVVAIWAFYTVFIASLAVLTIAFTATGTDLASSFFLSVSALTNSGPTIYSMDTSFAGFPALNAMAQAIYCLGMILGRLEIMGLLALMTRSFWRN